MNGNYVSDYLTFHLTRTKNQSKKSLHIWLPELFCKPVFLQKQLICDFWVGNNYPDSPHLQGYEICHTNFTST